MNIFIHIKYSFVKKILLLSTVFTILINILTTPIYGKTNDYSETIRSFIYTFDGKNVSVEYIKDLKDINNSYSYQLYCVDTTGYAVVTRNTQNIIEINYSNIPSTDKDYYISPGEFWNANDYKIFNNNISLLKATDTNINSIYQTTSTILNEKHVNFNLEAVEENNNTRVTVVNRPYPNIPSIIKDGVTVGIQDSNMDTFNGDKWINEHNQCGAYASAVMITYMDKYHGGNYFKETGSYEQGSVLDRLKNKITGYSSANQVLNAINTIFLEDYPNGGKHGTVTSTENTYKSKIKSKYPVCLLLQTSHGSSYGDHWVCAYQYVDYNGYLWFKVHDNRSGNNHRGWVNRNWIYKGIYTN